MALLFGLFGKLGSIFSRKKKSTIETLEELDKEIKDFEKYKQRNELNEKKYIGALVLYSIVLYIIGAIVYYIYLMPNNLVDRLKTLIPFLISPLIIYGIRRFLKWFFIKRTSYFDKKLNDLKDEKRTILEDVKEKETYKKAKEILERFASGVDISITPPSTPMNTTIMNPKSNNLNNTINLNTPYVNKNSIQSNNQLNSSSTNQLVHRNVRHLQEGSQNNVNKSTPNGQLNYSMQLPPKQKNSNPNTSILNATTVGHNTINTNNNNNQNFVQPQGLPPLPPNGQSTQVPPPPSSMAAARTLLPRPIVAPNRTFFDKLLDFIIGEGPNNRYALICKSCHFHNGMALKEEFEYVAFRCAYCLYYNEARKTKLTVPKLNTKSTSNNANNEEQNQDNQNDSMASSTLSSSNSFDEINNLSEPISSSSVVPAQKSQTQISKPKNFAEQFYNKNNSESNGKLRKNSLTESSSNNKLNVNAKNKESSKSMEKLINSNDIEMASYVEDDDIGRKKINGEEEENVENEK